MTQSPSFVMLIVILLWTFAFHLGSGSSSPSSLLLSNNATRIIGSDESSSNIVQQQSRHLQQQQQQQQQKRIQQPPATNDPDYIYPLSYGGNLNEAGHDGLIIFSTQLGSSSRSSRSSSSGNDVKEVKARYFFVTDNYDSSSSSSSSSSGNNDNKVEEEEAQVQYYIVPSSDNGRISSSASASSGECREVTIKVWGGGGGGCDGGRTGKIISDVDETTDVVNDTNDMDVTSNNNNNSNNFYSVGSAGHYIQSTFLLPVGEKLKIVVGGGGKSSQSQSHSLGGRGGYNGGYPGRSDRASGGGGGGGYSYVSFVSNGTVLLAAYGGNGGGNTTYCTARGGPGGRLVGRSKKENDGGGAGYYIAHDLALLPSSSSSSYHKDNNNAVVCLSVPSIAEMTHNTVIFIWDAGPCQHEVLRELYVHKYAVHIASAYDNNPQDSNEMKDTCPDDINDYDLHEYIQRGTHAKDTMTIVTDLSPSTSYCLHVKAFSIQGSILGVRVVRFVTKPVPINEWLPVTVRRLDVSLVHESTTSVTKNVNGDGSTNTRGVSRSWCEHSSTIPTGRRGHTMTVMNNQVYIFGGATMQCVCELHIVNNEEKRVCSSKNVYSNELWHYDPLASMFTQLGWNTTADDNEEKRPWPQGREQHSMTTLPNGHLVLIGGISSSNDDYAIGDGKANVLLNDVWSMKDPRRIIPSLVFRSSNAPIDLIPGGVLSHVIPISTLNSELLIDDAESMCLHDISIKFSLDLVCSNQIQFIKLTAPKVSTQGVSNYHDTTQSRDYETKIFVSREESTEKECQHPSSVDLVLSDNAEEWILSHASIPTSGTFRPASSLASTFGGLPINGEWELSISMSKQSMNSTTTIMDNHNGRLLDWELIMDVTPCNANQPSWTKLPSPPIEFTPRRLHTAVAVGNSIFISGGYSATRRLDNDMWRFDFDTNTWTDLTTKHNTGVVHKESSRRYLPLYGQASFLSPWGVLAYGGMTKYGTRNHGHDMFLFDLFKSDWVSVPMSSNSDIPHGRYLSSIGLLSSNNENSITNKKGPMILTFGGDGGHLHNAQADEYGFMTNSLFNDIWLLSPGELIATEPTSRYYDLCHWRTIPNSTAIQIWDRSCGIVVIDDPLSSSSKVGEGNNNWTSSHADDGCHLESILIAAWCQGQYQSF